MRLASALSALVAFAACLTLAACGGDGGSAAFPDHPTSVGPIGKAADGVWLFRPAGKPKSLVVFIHGQGGPGEAVPTNHRAWIDHLVDRGSAVVYPRYELAYERSPMRHIVAGVRAAEDRLGVDELPVLGIGYSRGGALVLEYAAVAAAEEVPVPQAIMSIFPVSQGDLGRVIDLSPLDPQTTLVVQIGDRDTVVRGEGARVLLHRLEAGGFPAAQIKLDFVRSHGEFTADHFAPLQTSAAAKAAFWRPADRLLAQMG